LVTVQVILDGATDGPGESLDLTLMPALAQLAATGETRWLDPLDPGVPVGSETAIASLLGWRPSGGVDRGRVEAAARGLTADRVRRVDLRGGHRLLVLGDARLESDAVSRIWPGGLTPPRILDASTVVVGAAGAATGLGALMGATSVVPSGATGAPGSDLAGKTNAALAALRQGARRIVVHVGGADTAAHGRDRAAKRAVLTVADREVIAPLVSAVGERAGRIEVGPDHGTDPDTGEHIGGPVPWIVWSAA
jgi:2,3-bisphosphoglycerate-independent phosphoglycerate mutase